MSGVISLHLQWIFTCFFDGFEVLSRESKEDWLVETCCFCGFAAAEVGETERGFPSPLRDVCDPAG